MDNLLNVPDVCEVEGLRCDGAIVVDLLDLGILLEDDAKVVFDRCEAFVGHFDHSVGEKVDHIFLYLQIELVRCFVKESALDLGAVHVDELDLEQAASVARHTLLRLRSDASLDLPVA